MKPSHTHFDIPALNYYLYSDIRYESIALYQKYYIMDIMFAKLYF